MESILAPLIGLLFAIGFYLLLQHNLVRLVIGLGVMSNAANLLLFTSGRLTRATPPIIPVEGSLMGAPFANPLSEALILTAIVIGFAMLTFFFVLAYKSQQQAEAIEPDGEAG